MVVGRTDLLPVKRPGRGGGCIPALAGCVQAKPG
jgi:hypothetical protein